MKTFTYLRKNVIWKLLSLFLILLASCEDTGTTSVVVYHNPFNTTLNIMFTDAQTGNPIGYGTDKAVHIQILGSDASLVADISGVKHTSYESANGFLSLGVSKSKAPSQSDPIEFTLVCTTSDYLSTSYPVIITETSHGNITINMVAMANPPEGVVTQVNHDISVNNGLVSQTTVVTSPTIPSINTRAALTIPENAILKDASGTALQGTLTTSLVYFSNLDATSLASFPGGGLMANVNTGVENTDGMFFSAGFVAIDIQDASGRVAKTIEGTPLQLDMEISDQTFNPITNAPVQPGDTIQLWSYEPTTGQWTLEGSAAIGGTRSNLNITASLHHLSWYNWDWFISYGCQWGYGSAQIRFLSSILQNGQVSYINLEAYQQGSGALIGSRLGEYGYYMQIDTYDGTSGVSIYGGPSNVPIVMKAKDPSGFEMGSVDISDLCQGIYDINLVPQGIPPSDSVTVKVYGFCPSNPLDTIFPSLAFWYKDMATNLNWLPGFLTNGKAVIHNIILNHTYKLGASLDGQWHEYNMVVNQTNYLFGVQFTQDICNQIEQ
ncbi:MAG: hypothetical protein M0R21_00035 [Lentimicrobiaceae bacterium]|nr:hypothetical protein [Lentimicrobiaceae bacterium]